jgi:hypothetical protein
MTDDMHPRGDDSMHQKRKELLDLLAARGSALPSSAARPATPEQLRKLAERAGGVNRLAVLLRFHQARRSPPKSRLDPSDN